MSPARRRLLVLSVLLILLVMAALMAEVAVRVRQSLRDQGVGQGIEALMRIDPATDTRVMTAGLKSARLNINALGFRGPEIAPEKPPNTIRIAFLGASTTFCAEVSSDADTWPQLVTERLRAAYPDRRFEYINAGVPGYTLATTTRNFRGRVAPLKPDIVVFYEATNDLTTNITTQAERQGIRASSGDQNLSWLSHHSLLVYLVEKNLQVRRLQSDADALAGALKVPSETLAQPYEKNLATLADTVRDVTDRIVFVTFSSRIRANQTPEQRNQAAATARYYMPSRAVADLITDFEAYNAAMRRVAGDKHITLIEVAERIPGDADHFVDSVHFTDKGSHLMADIVGTGLLETGVLKAVVGR
jgi:lysophospholipase L1-like esterase